MLTIPISIIIVQCLAVDSEHEFSDAGNSQHILIVSSKWDSVEPTDSNEQTA